MLKSIYRASVPERPSTPLSASTLLTRSRAEPSLGRELGCEIACADRIDILSAFITVGGFRAGRQEVERASLRGVRVRILTSVFTGTTEVEALSQLASLEGVEVRVSFDVNRTRLHAKAWLFGRHSGLHTAYVGSANWTTTALGVGQEWMVKVCAADLPDVISKFEGTFEGLWNDADFEPFDPRSVEQRERLQRALGAEKTAGTDVTQLYSLRPFAYQQAILDRLQAERRLHDRWRNLVVAATGTGKTVIAAFDYASECRTAGAPPRLLFLAHRKELLEQALHTFRNALHDGAFGELLVDGRVPVRWDHVFASIQSFANVLGDRIAADHFRFVVIDEGHHAPADSYQRVIRAITPEILVGLTATPERTDGKSLLPDFGGRIAAELRLWHALEKSLLVPFEYCGISDNTDLRSIRWNRGSYLAADLANVYTGNQARVDLVIAQLRLRVGDPTRIRAIAFCVSVEHADFMARELTGRGVPAEAVHGGTPGDARNAAPQRLKSRAINVICTVDLYNEGVDLPYVDTLLLLRPSSAPPRAPPSSSSSSVAACASTRRNPPVWSSTSSASIATNSASTASTPPSPVCPARASRRPWRRASHSSPAAASSSSTRLLGARSSSHSSASSPMPAPSPASCRSCVPQTRPSPSRSSSTRAGVRSKRSMTPADAGGWTAIRQRAGAIAEQPEETRKLTKTFERLVHTDDPAQLALWSPGGILRAAEDTVGRRRVTMLEHQLRERTLLADPADGLPWLFDSDAARDELRELSEVLGDRIPSANDVHPVPEWPLALHRHYARREIVAAVGYVQPGQKGNIPQHPPGRHSQARREEGAIAGDAGRVGRIVLTDHSLSRLRNQPDPLPLGDPDGGERRARIGAEVCGEPMERMDLPPVRAAPPGCDVRVSGAGDVRVGREGPADRGDLAAGARHVGRVV